MCHVQCLVLSKRAPKNRSKDHVGQVTLCSKTNKNSDIPDFFFRREASQTPGEQTSSMSHYTTHVSRQLIIYNEALRLSATRMSAQNWPSFLSSDDNRANTFTFYSITTDTPGCVSLWIQRVLMTILWGKKISTILLGVCQHCVLGICLTKLSLFTSSLIYGMPYRIISCLLNGAHYFLKHGKFLKREPKYNCNLDYNKMTVVHFTELSFPEGISSSGCFYWDGHQNERPQWPGLKGSC